MTIETPPGNDLRSLIVEEWPTIDLAQLDACATDEPALILLIASTADCTRVRAKRDLEELKQLSKSGPSNLEQRFAAELERIEARLQPFLEEGKQQAAETFDELKERGAELVDQAETHLDEAQEKIKAEWDKHLETTIPQAEEMLKRNIWSSLAIAFGLGMIVALSGGSRGR